MIEIKTKSYKAVNPRGDLTRGEFGEVVRNIHVVTDTNGEYNSPSIGDILVWDSTFGWLLGDDWASKWAIKFADSLL